MYSQIFFSRNVGNSIECEKNITPPPPQTTPTFEIQNQNKGIEDIMDIDCNCPSLLFGETTSHLTSKWRGTFQYFFLCWKKHKTWNEKKIVFPKRKSTRRKHEILKKKILKFYFFQYLKNSLKNSNNIPSISKTKRDGQTDRQTGGRCNISRPGPSAPREIINCHLMSVKLSIWLLIVHKTQN